jgi:lysyl endopeptidase
LAAAIALLCFPLLLAAQDGGAPMRGQAGILDIPGARLLDPPPEPTPIKVIPPSLADPRAAEALSPRYTMPALDVRPFLEEDRQARAIGERRTRTGVVRSVPAEAVRNGAWTEIDGRFLWRLTISSPGALFSRIRFQGFHLPGGGQLFVYPSGHPDAAQRFTEDGPGSQADFWGTVLPGDSVDVEYTAPGREDVLPFRIVGFAHGYLDPRAAEVRAPEEPALAGSCNLDVSCYPDWIQSADSLAVVSFVSGGYSYYCSGALVNNASGDLSPLFLTARHCISLEEEAASAAFSFRYRSASCGSNQLTSPRWNATERSQILSTSATNDMTMLKILGGVPSPLYLSGVFLGSPVTGEPVTAIHHPSAAYQKISFGSLLAQNNVYPSYHRVLWSAGVTEPGSSGSPLLNANHQVEGVLSFGSSSCATPTGSDYYGKVALADATMQGYLQNGLPDDDLEWNETAALATPITLPFDRSGLVLKAKARHDWFKFTTPPDKLILVRVDFAGSTISNFSELFLGLNGPRVSSLGFDLGGVAYPTVGSEPMQYFLHVYMPFELRAEYRLRISLIDPPVIQISGSFRPFFPEYRKVGASYQLSSIGFPGTTWLEYSKDPAWTTWTTLPAQSFTATPYSLSFSSEIDWLDPDTTYNFRAAAQNAGGTYRSPVYTVTTGPIPVPSGYFPVDGSVEQHPTPDLSWTGGLCPYDLYLGLTPDPPLLASLEDLGTGCMIGRYVSNLLLESGSRYYWRIVNKYKEFRVPSEVRSFTTWGPKIAFSPQRFVDFGPRPWTTLATASVTLTNQSSIDFQFSNSITGPYQLLQGCSTLLAGQSCSVTVKFLTSTLGPASGSLVLTDSAQGLTYTIPLSGTVVDITLSLSRPVRPSRGGSGGGSAAQRSAVVTVAGQGAPDSSVALSCVAPVGFACTLSASSAPLDGAVHSVEVAAAVPRPLASRRALRLGGAPAQARAITVRVIAAFGGLSRSVDVPLIVE